MKAVGLITEYNPLHNGHIYHLEESMKVSKADLNIVVMSGNFVQRGEPAIIDKYARCEASIRSGANLVVELPSYYALSSAEGFAAGAVKTLHALQVDSLVFGSESGDLALFSQIAELLCNEPGSYREYLKNELAKGVSFPAARQTAMKQYLINDKKSEVDNMEQFSEKLDQVLSSPNNILGIEYLKAISHYAPEITPYTIVRKGTGYHETTVSGLPSASAIRKQLSASLTELTELVPPAMAELMKNKFNHTFPIDVDDFTSILNYKLEAIFHQCNYNKNEASLELSTYYDISIDLANRIYEVYQPSLTVSEFTMVLKTKQYTYSRISRCLFHIILDMKKLNYAKYIGNDVPYIRILGFDQVGQKYLGHIKKKCSVPIITKTADNKDLLQDDIYVSNIYNQVIFQKYHELLSDEFRSGVYRKC